MTSPTYKILSSTLVDILFKIKKELENHTIPIGVLPNDSIFVSYELVKTNFPTRPRSKKYQIVLLDKGGQRYSIGIYYADLLSVHKFKVNIDFISAESSDKSLEEIKQGSEILNQFNEMYDYILERKYENILAFSK